MFNKELKIKVKILENKCLSYQDSISKLQHRLDNPIKYKVGDTVFHDCEKYTIVYSFLDYSGENGYRQYRNKYNLRKVNNPDVFTHLFESEIISEENMKDVCKELELCNCKNKKNESKGDTKV